MQYDRRIENWICLVAGFVSGMLIGFNGFMWSQSIIVEVYPFSMLSMTAVLCFLLRWMYAPHQHRYLYIAWFLCGITFNNHQSLLVVALGLEVAVIAASPRLGRELLLWNTVVYIGGLFGKSIGMVNVLSDNTPLLIIYNLIGIASAIGWVALLVALFFSLWAGRLAAESWANWLEFWNGEPFHLADQESLVHVAHGCPLRWSHQYSALNSGPRQGSTSGPIREAGPAAIAMASALPSRIPPGQRRRHQGRGGASVGAGDMVSSLLAS